MSITRSRGKTGYDCQMTTRYDKGVTMSNDKDEYGNFPLGAMRGIRIFRVIDERS
jgi:hypothetical protein